MLMSFVTIIHIDKVYVDILKGRNDFGRVTFVNYMTLNVMNIVKVKFFESFIKYNSYIVLYISKKISLNNVPQHSVYV